MPTGRYIIPTLHFRLAGLVVSSSHLNRACPFTTHRCPHCRHFRNHFVQLARQVTTVAQGEGVTVTVHAVSCTEYKPIWCVRGKVSLRNYINVIIDNIIMML